MADWKADFDALVNETVAFAKGISHERPLPRDVVEREEISRRVANFKAHQQRFMREREDYAASVLKRMLASRR